MTIKYLDNRIQEEGMTMKISFDAWSKPGHLSKTLPKEPNNTNWIWGLHADVHDFNTNSIQLRESSKQIFSAHFGHLTIISIWLSGMHFHGARTSNYEEWLMHPISIHPTMQVVWPLVGQSILNGFVGGNYKGIQTTAGFFPLWLAFGITSELQLYVTAVGGLCIAFISLIAGWYHFHAATLKLSWFKNAESMLNHHLAALIGMGSLAWTGHQIHVTLPITRLLLGNVDFKEIPLPHAFLIDRYFLNQIYPGFAGGLVKLLSLDWYDYFGLLTFIGGLNPATGSLWLTDIAHHHLAIAVLFIIAGHMYRTNFGIGHSIQSIMNKHRGPITAQGHESFAALLTTSWHAQLSTNLAMIGSLVIIIAHHMYAMPAHPFLSVDYGTQLSLFVHHCWIGGFIIIGSSAHAAIFMLKDYQPIDNHTNQLNRMLIHRDALISQLNWVCLFLGFHSFGIYIHNDTMNALGRIKDMFSDTAICLQPIFAQWIQTIHAKASISAVTGGLPWDDGMLATDGFIATTFIPLGTADSLVHHIHAFTLHVTVLIALKGLLFARGSRLIPGKYSLGYRFPCDGPGRGGTCQVSAWDHMLLSLFWMYNAISVVIFHFSWKMQSDVWGRINDGNIVHLTGGNLATSAITTNGWLRDFVWAKASQVIQSYGSSSAAYGLLFPGSHFIWAFSLMFLFSGRGYWQESIETVIWAHEQLNVSPSIQPRALSIIQGRAVGVAHYLLGGIVTTWAFFLARINAVS